MRTNKNIIKEGRGKGKIVANNKKPKVNSMNLNKKMKKEK
jgi:hypothetical protein